MQKQISKEIYNKLDRAKNIASLYPDKAIDMCREVCEFANSEDLKLELAYAYLNIAFANRIKSDTAAMLENAYAALSIFEIKNDFIGQARAFNLIGVSYFYSSMYDEALKFFLDGKDLLEVYKEDNILTSILNNIGEIYRETELYDKAIEYYDAAIEIASKNENFINHAVILGNIGEIHFTENNFKKALEVYQQSYNMLLKTSEMVSLGDAENRIGKVYFQMKEFENAEEYYIKAFKRLNDLDNKYYRIDVLINIGKLNEVKSIGRTLHFYERAMGFAESIGSKKKLCNIYEIISQYHETQGDYKNSLLYYKKYFNISEELVNLNLKSKLEILNIDLKNIKDMNKFDNIRIRLEKEIDRQKNEIDNISKSNKILEKKAYEDELTGVANRRSVNIYLESLLNEISLDQEKVVLFMMDIDKFKGYNDYWGHAEGDICLKKIAGCIKAIQQSNGDMFGRYGGEEFIYISTSSDYNKSLELGNLIRREVEKIGLYYIEEGERKPTTISIGGVIGDIMEFTSIREIMELADRELYRAKDMGRNMTILKDLDK
nr:diguanylate cyclase [Tissierella sp.]